MAISSEQAVELADYLPEGMRCSNARERLLCLVEVLQRLTDRNHTLSNADIRAILRARFGDACAPSENTIAADLRAIAQSGCLDLALHTTPSGVWCEHPKLTPQEVRLLLNAVQSSRFLTMEQSFDLQENLYDLVSHYQEDDLTAQVHVAERVRSGHQHVLDAVDIIARAMRTDRRIEFEYTYTDFGGKARVLEGDSGSTVRCETPVALYYSGGNYYAETYTSTPWRHGIELMRSRIDRMTNTRVSEVPAERNRTVANARRSARKRMEREFGMVDGRPRWVFLRVRADMTNVVFDCFGFRIKFSQFEGEMGQPDATGLTLVSIAQAFTFYRWLSSAGPGIVISEPPMDIVLRSGPWARSLKNVTHEELVEDYHSTLEGFLAFLDRAREPYA